MGDITYIHTREGCVYPAGRDGAAYSKRIVGYAIAGTHANRIGQKRSAKLAVRNCQPIKGVTILPFRFGDTRCTSADYTAFMNKYGIHRFGGKNRRVPRTAPQRISFNATRAGKNSSTSRIYHTRRKAIKEVTSWIEH